MNNQEIESAINVLDGNVEGFENLLQNQSDHPMRGPIEHQIDCLKLAISALRLQLNNGWIPVSSGNLPGRYERVHVYVTLKHVEGQHEFTAKMIWWLGKFQWANGKEISEKYKIIAWMPERSPEAYKEV
jgi:hypothetical protein